MVLELIYFRPDTRSVVKFPVEADEIPADEVPLAWKAISDTYRPAPDFELVELHRCVAENR